MQNKFLVPALAAIALLLSLGILLLMAPWGNTEHTEISSIGFTGTFQAGPDGVPLSLAEHKLFSVADADEVILKGHFDRPLADHTQLFFLIKYLEVHIYLDGAELYSFGTPESHPAITRSSGMSWNHCVMPHGLSQEDEVTIVLRNPYPNNYYSAYRDFLRSLCVGDSGALALSLWRDNWLSLIIGFVLLFACLISLAFYILLFLQKIKLHSSVYYFSCFAAVLSFWMLLTPRLSTLLLSNPVAVMQMETFCLLIVCPLYLAYLSSFLRPKVRRLNTILLVLTLLLSIISLLLQITGIMDAYYIRTPLTVFMGFLGLVCLAEVIFDMRRFKSTEYQYVFIPLLVFCIFGVLELLNYALEILPLGQFLLLGLLVLVSFQLIQAYRYIKSAIVRANQAAKLESELAQSRISIMLSQIQPHFLFNSLSTIKGLCQFDPGRAELAIDHFSDFLRGNINALTSAALLPFSQELYHTQQYLELEQMRFGERLHVVYDTPVTLFRLPSLTLQPIVENAVRHGLMKRRAGGTVTIQTAESETHYIVLVIDDGLGFDPASPTDTDRAHIGISNVRERLRSQCGGALDIQSEPNMGTTVRVLIPKESYPV